MFNYLYKKFFQLFRGVRFGKRVKIAFPCNLYNCFLDDDVYIGRFVEVQDFVTIGKRSRISTHSFIASGCYIGNDVFVGHSVVTTNDLYPKANNPDYINKLVSIEHGASIGSNATLVGPVTVGRDALVGAGAVLIKSVPRDEIWAGNPAKKLNKKNEIGFKV